MLYSWNTRILKMVITNSSNTNSNEMGDTVTVDSSSTLSNSVTVTVMVSNSKL